MKPGDRVRHRFKGSDTDTGIIIRCYEKVTTRPGEMVEVAWCRLSPLKNDWLYHSEHLEVISESQRR